MNLITEENRKWWVLIALCMASVLINLDTTIVNLAIPEIARVMRASLNKMQWVGNIFTFGAALSFVLAGRLSDVIGSRKVFLSGMLVFLFASIVCGAAPNIPILLIGRFLQGFGFAFCLPIIVVITRHIFPEHKWGLVMGIVATIAGLSQAIGPTLGGVILEFLSWRWVFFINVPVCLLSLWLLRVSYRKNDETRDEKIDYIGVGILGTGILCLLTALNQIAVLGFTSFIFWGLILIGLCALYGFYYFEQRQKHPLVDFDLFKLRNYLLVVLMRPLQMILWATVLFLFPIYMINILGFNPIKSGVTLLTMTLIFGLSSPLMGKLSDRYGIKTMLISSNILSVIVFTLLLFTNANSLGWQFYTAMVLYGFVIGIILINTVRAAMSALPAEKAGAGTGIFYTVVSFGIGLGYALSGAIITLVSHHHLQHALTKRSWNFGEIQHTWLMNAVNGTRPLHEVARHFPADQFHKVLPIIKHSFISGFHAVMAFNIVLAGITLLLAFMLREAE